MLPSLTLLHQLRLRGSLTAAAEATNTSRSAASHQLAGLQRRLGVTLTERVGRGLRLTEAGHALALQAARVLSEMERTTAIAEQSRVTWRVRSSWPRSKPSPLRSFPGC